jgi:peptidoglycan biosynthesis protein MviN/MurJ (putative lipid II flippase)
MKSKFWEDIIFEHKEHSQKRWMGFFLGLLTILDAILLMLKEWIIDKEITNMDISLFWALFGGWGVAIGGAMVNKMKAFRNSTNEEKKEKQEEPEI